MFCVFIYNTNCYFIIKINLVSLSLRQRVQYSQHFQNQMDARIGRGDLRKTSLSLEFWFSHLLILSDDEMIFMFISKNKNDNRLKT